MHRHVELLDRLDPEALDQVLGQDLRVAGDVEDPLLRIQGGQLAAQLGQRIDDPGVGLPHPGPEGGAETDRSGPDDGDVPDLVEVQRKLG